MKNEIALFHIGRGGRFNNPGHLRFVAFKRIDDTHHFQMCFDKNRDANGRFCKPYLTDCNGNMIMNADEFKEALDTGIGRLDFDGPYSTFYTTFLSDLSEDELTAIERTKDGDLIEYVDEYLNSL